MALNGTPASYHPFVEARPLARPASDAPPTSQLPLRILYVEHQPDTDLAFIRRYGPSVHIRPVATGDEALRALREYYPADAVVVSQESGGLALLEQIRRVPWLRDMPVLLLVPHVTAVLRAELRRWPDTDLFPSDFSRGDLLARLTYFARRRQFSSRRSAESGSLSVRVPWWKRSFDVAVSGTALLLLSPVLAAVALAIRFDSPGPVIYRSKRVGAGYRIFDLYKFRSMRTGADAQVKQMGALNLYNRADEVPTASLCDTCRAAGSACRQPLFLDGEQVCERLYSKQARSKAAFMKFQNDPRVTRLGAFLRNSSLDELPQLVNIFLGDMSLVGNRPLPLYEAEKLTSDDYIQRFAGPAGLTGLWQVTKRGKGREDMSEEERMQLDIEYARNFSFGMDLKIILKTFPALIQSANV
jgi:lipopolysaccharide/colanic/teichoic acid biosynthesis glycosyltransferase